MTAESRVARGTTWGTNNITMNFDFGRPVENLRVFFGELGGNVNLTINGDFRNVFGFDDLNEQIVGGTFVEVSLSPTGLGIMVINGTVNSFSIGGQELWIDDICEATIQTGCIEFEDLPLAEEYEYGQFFVDSGVGMLVEEFSGSRRARPRPDLHGLTTLRRPVAPARISIRTT